MARLSRKRCWLAWLVAMLVASSSLVIAGDVPLREVIDAELGQVWSREKITPAGPCDEATFLRRVSLDVCGLIPTADEAKSFLDDTSTDKRAALVERLLNHPRYGVHQADVWDMLYFGRNPPGYEARDREGFQRWLRDAFAQNMHYDELARDRKSVV